VLLNKEADRTFLHSLGDMYSSKTVLAAISWKKTLAFLIIGV